MVLIPSRASAMSARESSCSTATTLGNSYPSCCKPVGGKDPYVDELGPLKTCFQARVSMRVRLVRHPIRGPRHCRDRRILRKCCPRRSNISTARNLTGLSVRQSAKQDDVYPGASKKVRQKRFLVRSKQSPNKHRRCPSFCSGCSACGPQLFTTQLQAALQWRPVGKIGSPDLPLESC